MPYDINIRITSEADLKALNLSEEATKKIRAELQQANQQMAQGTQQASQNATRSYNAFADASGKLAITQRNLGQAVGVVASQVGGLGPVANLASNAITTMAVASGPAGIALAGLATTVGLLVYRIEQARERMRELSEIEIAALARETRALGIENELKRRIAILQSAKPEIEEITQKYAALRLELENGGARPQALAAVDRVRDLEIGAAAKKQAEDQKRATDQARESILSQIDAVNAQQKALDEGEAAAARYTIGTLASSEAVIKLGEEGKDLLKILMQKKVAFIEANEARERSTRVSAELARQWEFERRVIQELRQEKERELETSQRAADHELNLMRARGGNEAQLLQREIELLRERQRVVQQSNLPNADERALEIARQAEIAETRLQRLGAVTVDVGAHVARTLDDLFTAAIQGTLKAVDVGRAAVSTVGRIVTDAFAQTIKNKLSFELTLLTNMRQLPGQMNSAFSSGAATVQGGGGSGGGFLDSIFSFFSNFGGSSGSSSSSGGGFMDIFSSLLNFGGGGGSGGGGGGFGSGFFGMGGSSGFLGSGFGGNPIMGGQSVQGPLLENGNFFSSFGGNASSFGNAGIGALIGLAMGAAQGGFEKENIGTTVGSTLGGLIGSYWGPIGSAAGSGIGGAIGGLFQSIFGKEDRRKTSPIRREKAFQSGLGRTRALGYDITQDELQLLQQAAQDGGGGAASQQFDAAIMDATLGAVIQRISTYQAKGGKALGNFQWTASGPIWVNHIAELQRRGFDPFQMNLFDQGTATRAQTLETRRVEVEDMIEQLSAQMQDTFTQSLIDAINDVEPNAYKEFTGNISGAVAASLQEGLAHQLIDQNVKPIMDAFLKPVLERFGRIGRDITGPDALAQSMGELQQLRYHLDGLRPVFEATTQIGKSLVDQIESILPGLEDETENIFRAPLRDAFAAGIQDGLTAAQQSRVYDDFLQNLANGLNGTIVDSMSDAFTRAHIEPAIEPLFRRITESFQWQPGEDFWSGIAQGRADIPELQARLAQLWPIFDAHAAVLKQFREAIESGLGIRSEEIERQLVAPVRDAFAAGIQAGLTEAQQAQVFDGLLQNLANGLTGTLTSSMSDAFTRAHIEPAIEPLFKTITESFQWEPGEDFWATIGQGMGNLPELEARLAQLRPIFDAHADVLRAWREAIERGLGIRSPEIEQALVPSIRNAFAAGIADGLTAAEQARVFDGFLGTLGDAVTGTMIDSVTEAFITKQIEPAIEPIFKRIMDNFGAIGEGGLTAEEALNRSRGDLDALGSQFEALRPIFDAMAEVLRDIRGEIRSGLKIREDVAGGGRKLDITVNLNEKGEIDPFTLARVINEALAGQLPPQ